MFAGLSSNVAADVIASMVLAGLGGISLWLRKQLHGVSQMTRDWNGEPARPGISDGQPGVMQRLYAQDKRMEDVMEHLSRQDATLAVIHHEINYNSGQSLKDFARRTHDNVTELSDTLDAHIESAREWEQSIEKRLDGDK